MRDVGTFRAVALADVVNRQFDGHPFAARQGIAQTEQQGWIVREQAQGPTGRPYTVLVATPAGAARAAVLWASAGRADQRVHSGAVKAADVGHEVAVYRAACAAQARIEAEGRARRPDPDRCRTQGASGRPGGAGAAGDGPGGGGGAAPRRSCTCRSRTARCSFRTHRSSTSPRRAWPGAATLRVASEHYGGGAIRAKAAAGFQMYAASGRARDGGAAGARGRWRGGWPQPARPRRWDSRGTRCSNCEAVAGGCRADDDGRGARRVGAVARTRVRAAVPGQSCWPIIDWKGDYIRKSQSPRRCLLINLDRHRPEDGAGQLLRRGFKASHPR